jgi:hypothetical protein
VLLLDAFREAMALSTTLPRCPRVDLSVKIPPPAGFGMATYL